MFTHRISSRPHLHGRHGSVKMFLKRTSFAIQAPQVHTEGSAVGEALFCKGVDDERVVTVPAVESWTGAHESDHCMGRVVGDTEDLLLDLGG